MTEILSLFFSIVSCCHGTWYSGDRGCRSGDLSRKVETQIRFSSNKTKEFARYWKGGVERYFKRGVGGVGGTEDGRKSRTKLLVKKFFKRD